MGAGQAAPSVTVATQVRIQLLGGFGVTTGGESVGLSADAQRLVAFLALEQRRVSRAFAAGTLWRDSTQERAFGNLRSALWRVRRRAKSLIDADTQSLAVSSDATIDVTSLIEAASCIKTPECTFTQLDHTIFTRALLPDWHDDWTMAARERLRQLSLHALEALAHRLVGQGRHAPAIEAILAAVALDPFRESAHRTLIRIHLDEGNRSEALRHFDSYRRLLDHEMGLEPSPQLARLIEVTR